MGDFRLQVFACVAHELSFTKASRVLHISQPAISKHIMELETLYGVQLFERRGSGVELTGAGERLKVLSDELLERYREIELEMSVLKGTVSGQLRLGASSTIAQYVISEILAKFIVRFPEVQVSLISGNSEQIEQALVDRKIDIGLVEGDSKRRNFHYEHFANDELVLVTSAGNKVREEVDIEEVIKLPLVLRENGSGTLEVILKALESYNKKFSDLNVVMQLGSTESIKSFLINSKAFAFVSIVAVSNELIGSKLKVIDVVGLEITRQFSFISLMGTHNDLVSRFVEFSKLSYNKKL